MKLEITKEELENLPREDWQWVKLNINILNRVIFAANAAGLAGRKIKEIIGLCHPATDSRTIDFVCEDSHEKA